MANTTTSEQIITALLQYGTKKKAAAALNISERALYDRTKAGEFKELYKAAKADIMREATAAANAALLEAIATVKDIMANKENNPAVRLQAAQTIINSAAKFADRLIEDEAMTDNQAEANKWNII